MTEIFKAEPIEPEGAPKSIWLNLGDEETSFEDAIKFGDVTWCDTQINEWDVEYIRADLVRKQDD